MGKRNLTIMNSVIELPFIQHVGLQIADDPSKVLQRPAGPRYLKHLGTVHASAQIALAEASSGEFLLWAIGNLTGIVPDQNSFAIRTTGRVNPFASGTS